jgi:hypothetical protein
MHMNLSMKSFIACLLAALTILSAAPVSAQIVLKSSGDYRDQLTRCTSWWECYKAQQIEKEKAAAATPLYPIYIPVVTAAVVPLVIQLPNLIPTDVDARFYGSNLQIKAQVDNVGEVDAQGFDYRAEVTFIRADTGATYGPHAVEQFIQSLQAGRNWDAVLGYVSPPDRNYDYDVVMDVVADSTNAQNGGAVWESNESDNTLSVTCRIFGYADGQGNLGQHPAC